MMSDDRRSQLQRALDFLRLHDRLRAEDPAYARHDIEHRASLVVGEHNAEGEPVGAVLRVELDFAEAEALLVRLLGDAL
jgi:hypothetical protein